MPTLPDWANPGELHNRLLIAIGPTATAWVEFGLVVILLLAALVKWVLVPLGIKRRSNDG